MNEDGEKSSAAQGAEAALEGISNVSSGAGAAEAGPETGNGKLTTTVEMEQDFQELQGIRNHEKQVAQANEGRMKADDKKAAGQQRGEAKGMENFASAGRFWGGVKAASNTQKAEDKTFRATAKGDGQTARETLKAQLSSYRSDVSTHRAAASVSKGLSK